MRKINLILLHCSATKDTQTYTPEQLERDHNARGFIQAGYHFYIRRNGEIVSMRPVEQIPAHAKGFNRNSIAICYEGGLDIRGKPADTRTDAQKDTLRKLLERLKEDYPGAYVVGHRNLPGVQKDCPCFEV